MSTFTTGFLRTVWEGSTLLEASLLPVEQVGYRPIPVTGEAARRAAALLWELSSTSAIADRDAEGDVRRYFSGVAEPETALGHVRMRNNLALLVDAAPSSTTVTVELAAGETIAELGFEGLIHAQSGGDTLQLGRDLFGWGHLEDALADDEIRNAAQWFVPSGGSYDPVLRLDPRAPNGFGWVELYRDASMQGDTFVRPHGRLNVPEHRLWLDTPEGASPGDGEAEYTMRVHARQHGRGRPYVRLELFEFDDTNPTEDPTTIPIGGPVDIPFEVPDDGQWHDIDIEIDPGVFWVDALRANVVLVRLRFAPPEQGESVLALDDFAFIEWRATSAAQDHFGDYRFVRSAAPGPASVSLVGMPLRDE
jgi:hypothetical protein